MSTCRNCNAVIPDGKKYCSKKCGLRYRSKIWRYKNKIHNFNMKQRKDICVSCGKLILPVFGKRLGSKFCSIKCRAHFHLKKYRVKNKEKLKMERKEQWIKLKNDSSRYKDFLGKKRNWRERRKENPEMYSKYLAKQRMFYRANHREPGIFAKVEPEKLSKYIEQVRQNARGWNRKSLITAINKQRPWTKMDDEKLIKNWFDVSVIWTPNLPRRNRNNIMKIARELGRTYFAVRTRARVLKEAVL